MSKSSLETKYLCRIVKARYRNSDECHVHVCTCMSKFLSHWEKYVEKRAEQDKNVCHVTEYNKIK